MNHILKLRQIGPIANCELEIKNFTVFTGPQSNGKSTVAKAVYFFRSVKQDILHIMMQGGPTKASGKNNVTWSYVLKQRMRDKFLQLFGLSWIMPPDMTMEYSYNEKFAIKVYLAVGQSDNKNFVEFQFSQAFDEYLCDLDFRSFVNLTANVKQSAEAELAFKLSDPYETVFIPAGRNLITLLSTQLNYIFTSLDAPQLRNIDYATRRYTELILRLKPHFSNGMAGLVEDAQNDPDRVDGYQKHRQAISLLRENINKVMNSKYRCVDGEERLYLDDKRFIKINYVSSGQQEIVWVFNLLLYYLVEDQQVFLILEEPESHLYPESQEIVGQVLGLFVNEGNCALITTHSPYLLGTFNYMLLAGQAHKSMDGLVKERVRKRFWLKKECVAAYHIHSGKVMSALDVSEGLSLINNSLIDGASTSINNITNLIIDGMYEAEHKDD